MKTAKPAYHHGDLRQTLISAAKQILRREGLAGLSMRKLAEVTSVSRSAPYHHFADKTALLCAIAVDGFRQQDELLDDMSPEGKPQQVFEDFVIAYIRFAAQNPQQYDLMFGSEIWRYGTATKDLEQAAKASFKRWVSVITRLQDQAVVRANVPALRLSQVTWATLHGLCRLLNDGIYVDPDDIDEMGRTAVALLLTTADR